MLPAYPTVTGLSSLIGWLFRRGSLLTGVSAAVLCACVGLADPRLQEACAPPTAASGSSGLSVRRLQLAGDGRTVWVTRLPHRLQNVDLATGRILIDMPIDAPLSPPPQITASGSHRVFMNQSGQLHVHRTGYDAEPIPFSRSLGGPIDKFAVDATGNVLAVASQDQVELWPLDEADQPLAITPLPRRVSALAFSPDGSRLLMLLWDGSLSLRDGYTLAERASVPTPIAGGSQVAWSADGRTAIAYGNFGPIAVWQVQEQTVPPHIEFGFRCTVAVSPDGTQLAICDAEQRQWLVDVAEPSCRQCLTRLPALATAMQFASADHLLIGTLNGDLLCWSLEDNMLAWEVRNDEG